MSQFKNETNALIATNRFGLGARPGEITLAGKNPKKWLTKCLANITPPDGAPSALMMMQLIADHKKYNDESNAVDVVPMTMMQSSQTSSMGEPLKHRTALYNNSALIVNHAIKSSESINWRLLDFFSNHFSVSAQDNKMRLLAPTLDWDAIAPNLMKPFEHMLISVISHPAMLVYLNNEKSIGPNSSAGKRRKKLGLNENLAREILELHTLGVDGGYDQDDVIEMAKAISGWGVAKTNKKNGYKVTEPFVFRDQYHEPGKRVLLGKLYPETKKGINQAKAMLKDLATHPATAHHICTKLAQHFISDIPPPKLVSAMKKSWLKTGGNLRSVYKTMINSPLSWLPKRVKLKTPREYVASTLRALDAKDIEAKIIINSLNDLGQRPYLARSPAGYGDIKSAWDGANALYSRIQWAARVAKNYRVANVDGLIQTMLGSEISQQSSQTIKRAESKQQAITLLLSSPEFLYR